MASADTDARLNALLHEIDLLFEPSPALRMLLLASESAFLAEAPEGVATPDVVYYVHRVLSQAAKAASSGKRDEVDAILNAHPRLGERRIESAASRAEQAAMVAASTSHPTSTSAPTNAPAADATATAASARAGQASAPDNAAEAHAVEDEAATLSALNAAYESTFPGLRFITFVAGRSRSLIFAEMRGRITEGDREKERTRAIDAMRDIALDRLSKRGKT